MNRDKNIRALNAYMRKRQLPEDVGGCLNGVLVFVAIIAVYGIVYAPEFTLPVIAIAIGAYCLWYFFWRNRPLTALGVTGEIFEDELYDELLEDYAWTVPLFNQKLLVGEKWLFPESAEHPVLMSGIESMRLHTADDPLLPVDKKLEVSLAPKGSDFTLMDFHDEDPSELAMGVLLACVKKANPDVVLEEPLDAMLTRRAQVYANRLMTVAVSTPFTCVGCKTEQADNLGYCRFCSTIRPDAAKDPSLASQEPPMTKDEFEVLMLGEGVSLEDYERNMLAGDVLRFYDLRSSVDLGSKEMRKPTARRFVNRDEYKEVERHIDKVKRFMYDENVQYRFVDYVREIDMQVVRGIFADKALAGRLIATAKRLNQYQRLKSLSVQEVMANADEKEFARKLEKSDPKRFEVWCEMHPGVDIHADDGKAL